MFNDVILLWVNKALVKLKQLVDEKTPIDTSTLIGNNIIIPATINWNIISWKVINETEYAPYVEYWVQGKGYNYYKGDRKSWWSPFYSWVWARMFTRTRDETEAEVKAMIEQELNLYIKSLNAKNGK